jgi:hypothetical protein
MDFDENRVIALLSVNPNGTQSFAHGQLKNAAIELVQTYGSDWAKSGVMRTREVSRIRGQIRKILVAYGPKEHINVSVNWRRLKDYAIAYEQEVGVINSVSKPPILLNETQIKLESSEIELDLHPEKKYFKFDPENLTKELTFRQIFALFFLKLKKLFK